MKRWQLQTEDYRPGNCKLTTTGRGLMAGRPSASGGLICARDLAQGVWLGFVTFFGPLCIVKRARTAST